MKTLRIIAIMLISIVLIFYVCGFITNKIVIGSSFILMAIIIYNLSFNQKDKLN